MRDEVSYREADDGGGAGRRPRAFQAAALGLAGVAALLSLMVWQIQRLDWKEGLIATLEERLAAPPLALPETWRPDVQEFRRVTARGRFTGEPGTHGFRDAAHLTSLRPWGAGYRVIQPFETADGRLLLVDRGYVPLAEKNERATAVRPTPAPDGEIALEAVLRWPEGADFFADGAAGLRDNVWLTREAERLAPLWGAEPVLLVAATDTSVGDWPLPRPPIVDLPNDHLSYAVTWGGLALVWAAMAAALVRRELRR